MPDETPRVGVIGLGRMGAAVCERLALLGFPMLAHDVRPQLRALAGELGAGWAGSVSELGARSDVVLTLLPGGAEVSLVAEPLTAAMAAGSAWIEMSTATPATAREISPRAAQAEIRYLDAPLGGQPQRARDGRLLAFAGGLREDLDALGDVLHALADRVLHVGPNGSGYLTKLLVNLLWFGQAVASAEAFAVAARSGVDPRVFLSAVQQSAAGGRFMDEAAGALLDGDDMTTFSLAGCSRELADAVDLARGCEVPAPISEAVAELYAQALGHYGDVDGELRAARLILERAGIELRS